MRLPRIFPPKKQDNALQVSARYKSGVALMEKDRLDEAEFQFKKALSLGPNHTAIHYCLGEINFQKEEFEQALISFEEALKTTDSKPEQATIHAALGATFLELKDFDRALQEYESALKLDPESNNIYWRIAEVYFELQQYDKAIKYFEQADKDDASVVVGLADAYWSQGNQNESIAILTEATKKFDDVPKVYAYLGYYLFETAQYEEAIKILEQALSLSEDYGEKTLFNLASSHYELGHLDKALEYYQKVIELFPDSAFTYRRIGFIYYEQDKLDDAIKIWQQMIPIDVDDPTGSHETLALGYRAKGDFKAALNEIRYVISLVPTDGTVYNLEGIILQDMNEQAAALAAFERAVELGNEFALINLAEGHQDLGHFDEATRYAESYIEAAKYNEELERLEDAQKIINANQ